MKFILVRHATTDWNLLGKIQGQTDIDLNKQGEEEAKKLADNLSGLGVASIRSSDLKRSENTAKIINKKLNVSLQLDTALRECSFGEIEGLTKQEALDKYGIIKDWDDQFKSYDFRKFEGGYRDEVFERHLSLIKRLAKDETEGSILLVGHGRGLATLLGGLGYTPTIKKGEYKIIDFEN